MLLSRILYLQKFHLGMHYEGVVFKVAICQSKEIVVRVGRS